MKKIVHSVHVAADPGKVFWALTSEDGLRGWWTREVHAQQGAGGMLDFRFTSDFSPDMEITEVLVDRKVAWKCIGGHDNWLNSSFSFELDPSNDGTDLLFVQVYAHELGDATYGRYNFDWGHYLSSLKQLCETGEGTPYRP